MTQTNYTYSLGNVNLSINGIDISAGGGSDGFIEITMPKFFESSSGVHGDSVTYKTGNREATFRLTLLQQEEANEDLISMITDDVNSDSGSGVGAFMLEDTGDGMEVSGECRLDGYPTVTKQAQASNYVYEGKILQVEMNYRSRNPTT